MNKLFTPYDLAGTPLKNRVVMPPHDSHPNLEQHNE